MDEVIPDLWISDIDTVRETSVEADHVVTVCQDNVADNIGCAYSHYELADGEPDGYGGRNDYALWVAAVEDVIDSYVRGKSVLVHCHVGRSRSASVCIAVVALLRRLRYEDAYAVVQDARSIEINPDPLLTSHVQQFLSDRIPHAQ